MRIAVPLIFALVATGCGARPDREPLTQFLHALKTPLKTDYEDKIRSHPDTEWTTRRLALMFRDHVAAIDSFLAGKPALTQRGSDLVDTIRVTCLEEAELFEKMVQEKRFQKTDAETKRLRELNEEYQEKLLKVGRRIDGED